MIYSTDYDRHVYLSDPDFACLDVDTGKIFKGNAYTGDYSPPYFDLAEFARNDMSLDFDWVDNVGAFAGVKRYDVTSGDSTQRVYMGYDSNINLGPEIGDFAMRNDHIKIIHRNNSDVFVAPGQDIFLTGFNSTATSIIYAFVGPGLQVAADTQALSFHARATIPESAVIGDTYYSAIGLDSGVGGIYQEEFYVIDSHCNYRFAIQYINRFGGLDTMLLDHEYQEYYTNTDLESNRRVARTNNRPILQKHQYHTIQNTGLKGFYLNTFMMNNDESSKMDHLMLSPMVFLQDIQEGITYPVNIIGKPFTVQRRNVNNTEVNKYQINVRISRDIIRRG